ncbi:hypothetical protein GCM10022420_082180 [Streptomyces iranensis]
MEPAGTGDEVVLVPMKPDAPDFDKRTRILIQDLAVTKRLRIAPARRPESARRGLRRLSDGRDISETSLPEH